MSWVLKLKMYTTTLLAFLSSFCSTLHIEPWGEGCGIDIPFRAKHSKDPYSLHVDKLWVYALIANYCKKLLWLRLSEAFIDGYSNKSLGIVLLLCPLSKIIVCFFLHCVYICVHVWDLICIWKSESNINIIVYELSIHSFSYEHFHFLCMFRTYWISVCHDPNIVQPRCGDLIVSQGDKAFPLNWAADSNTSSNRLHGIKFSRKAMEGSGRIGCPGGALPRSWHGRIGVKEVRVGSVGVLGTCF